MTSTGKGPLNYTTTIDAQKSAGECIAALAKHGATSIGIRFDQAVPVGLSFQIRTPWGIRAFSLPVNIPGTEFGNVGVGTNPPANTQLIDFTFNETVTFTAGVGSIALTAFSYGYTPIAEAGSGLAQFGVVPDIPTSTLSTLKVGCWNYGATPLPTAYTGVIDVICRILGA